MFFVKYFILYGVSKSMAELDGLDGVFAPPPHCIAHMNQTSYLWRKFDQGLYAFLFKYFYSPLTGSHRSSAIRRMASSAVCFSIIAVWHEQMQSFSIIAWVLVNFVLLNLELLGSIARRSDWCKSIEAS